MLARPRNFDGILRHLFVYGFVAWVLIPIGYIVLSTFKTTEEINRVLSLPSSLYVDNLRRVLSSPLFATGLLNSFVITVSAVLLAVGTASLAGYAIGRGSSALLTAVYLFFLSSLMIPTAGNLVSLYTLMRSLGLIDSRLGLILIDASGAIPLGVLIYASYMKTIPRELDEAATIDGCGYFGRFRLVILPLLRPAIIAHVSISSIAIWSNFVLPLLLISSSEKKPLVLAVYTFATEHVADFGAIFALLTLAMLIPAGFFVLVQRYVYEGVAAGAVKG